MVRFGVGASDKTRKYSAVVIKNIIFPKENVLFPVQNLKNFPKEREGGLATQISKHKGGGGGGLFSYRWYIDIYH